VSVIIPAYNEEKLIRKTLISVKRQTYKPIEIIVVNNNSTDKTAKIAQEYTDKVLFLKRKGAATAMNFGARKAKGQYFLFLDADSRISKNTVYNSIKFLRRGFSGGRIKAEYEKKDNKIKLFEVIQNSVLVKVGFYTGPFLYTKRELFQKIGGLNEKIQFGYDIDLMKRLSRFGRIKNDLYSIAKTSSRRHGQNGHFLYVMSAGILVLLGIKNLPYPTINKNKRVKNNRKFLSLQEFYNLINVNNLKDFLRNFLKNNLRD